MVRENRSLDDIDLRIIEILQKDCRVPLEKIAQTLTVPKSTIHYRTKRLEAEGIIKGYYANLDATKFGEDYVTVTFVRAKYGPSYHERVGEMISKIRGVFGVYFVFGETDFIVLTRSRSREDFLKKLEKMIDTPEIERTNTMVVAKIIKEDTRIEM